MSSRPIGLQRSVHMLWRPQPWQDIHDHECVKVLSYRRRRRRFHTKIFHMHCIALRRRDAPCRAVPDPVWKNLVESSCVWRNQQMISRHIHCCKRRLNVTQAETDQSINQYFVIHPKQKLHNSPICITTGRTGGGAVLTSAQTITILLP